MIQPLVSIIIPIYNTDLTIFKQCLNSVLKQKYRNLEIILVDDGSAETISHYLDEIALKNTQLYVYHRRHGGASSARNWGIKKAKGEYITFIDADDSISPDMISFSMNYAITCKADIVLWDHVKINKNTKDLPDPCQENPKITIFQADQIVELQKSIWNTKQNKECTSLKSLPLSVCKLYTSRLLKQNSLFFSDTVSIGEDTLFALEALEHTEKLVAIDKVMYFHKIYEISLSHGYHSDALLSWSENRKVFRNYLLEGKLTSELWKAYDLQAIFAVKTLLINTFAHPKCTLKRKDLKKILAADEFAHSLSAIKWKDIKNDTGALVILFCNKLHLYKALILIGRIRRKQLEKQLSK